MTVFEYSFNLILVSAVWVVVMSAAEEKRLLLNDPNLIHSQISAMQHQIQELNSKYQEQQTKLLAQERLISDLQTSAKSGTCSPYIVLHPFEIFTL